MALGSYTVSTEPQHARDYPNKKGSGELSVWRLGLKEARSTAEDNLFELHKRKGNDPPPVGTVLEVDRVQEGEFNGAQFARLFLVDTYKGDKGGPGGGGGGNPRRDQGPGLRWHNAPYNSSASHPRDEVRMIRTSALSSAPAYIESMFTFAPLEGVERPKTAAEYWVLVNRVVERLEASYHSALGAYDERVSPPQQLAAEVPADTDGLSEEQRAHDASIPF